MPRDLNALAKTVRSPCRRLVAVLVRSHLDRRHGDGARRVMTHNATTPSPHYAARAPRSVNRYCMTRYTRGTRATEFECAGNDVSNPTLPTGHGVGAVAPPPTAWGWSAPRVDQLQSHNKSALHGACSAVCRALLHDTIRTREARHGIKTCLSRPFEAPGVERSRCWCGRASADGEWRTAPRVGPHHNNARSALRSACTAVHWPLLHGAIPARGRAPRD